MKSRDKNISESNVLIEVTNLSKCYHIYEKPQHRLLQSIFRGKKKYYRDFWALKDVSLQVRRGEAVGIVGSNGAGKSTLLQLITGTVAPTSGEIKVHGRIAALLQLGSGFNPEFTGRENIYLNGAILGFSRAEIETRFDEIAAFADIGDFIEQPVKIYSSGMTMRLAFAVSICLQPDVLIVDEALAVGDAIFQRKCYANLEKFLEKGGALLFVSHSLELVKKICNEAVYLKNGIVRLASSPHRVALAYEYDQDQQTNIVRPAADVDIEVVDEYGDKRAEILNVWIENSLGEKVLSIGFKESFSWCYRVKFNSKIDQVNFGMRLVNREGLILFGANNQILNHPYEPCDSSSLRTIKFKFKSNPLSPGDYFLSAGVSEFTGIFDSFLHRKTDCFHLKIQSSETSVSTGMIDMSAELELL